MSVKSFKFVSPGVFINEIDNSFTPKTADAIGPVVIGRSTKGLAMQPVTVQSYADFVDMFGDTVPGHAGGDISRDGNYQSPMYGTYASKAFLKSNVAPLTYVRLLGQEHSEATDDGKAGWKTAKSPNNSADENGGAFGLFIFPSSSNLNTDTGNIGTGQLGAVFYLNQSGTIQLSGTLAGASSPEGQGSGVVVKTNTSDNYTLVISSSAGDYEKKIVFNLNEDSDLYARKVFNTNPQLVSGKGDFFPSASYTPYWLGESYEQYLKNDTTVDLTSGVDQAAVILPIAKNGTVADGPHNMQAATSEANTGWFIGQDLGATGSFVAADMQKLFRLKGRGHGEWLSTHCKVSIENINKSNSKSTDYGTFSVVIRNLLDTDTHVQVLERFDNCTLDPSSPNFLARKIGDTYYEWDSTDRRLKQYGEYPNQSKFVHVEMNSDVEVGATDPALLPFGYFGIPKFESVTDASGSADFANKFVTTDSLSDATVPFSSSGGAMTASLEFPGQILRVSASDGALTDPTRAFFGFSSAKTPSSTRADASVKHLGKLLYAGWVSGATGTDAYDTVFSMNDLSSSAGGFVYVAGSRALGDAQSFDTILDSGYDSFTAPLFGAFDGFDIKVPDPVYNKGMASATETNNYAYHTFKKAIDTVADPEFVDMNLMVAPGLTVEGLTTHMVDVCESRADAMALVDLADVYIPLHEQYDDGNKKNRIGTTPRQAANNLKTRQIDSSYGATFYPWVQTRDENTGQLVWAPPSVAMMGVLASSQAKTDLWFAPAGFNRGGLSDGAAGIPITNVSERLVSKDRDLLYEAKINPIASFPSTGIVVFGQKTLQEGASALDRINVRRLVIYLKKQISVLSSQVLFEQNVPATWNRFKGLVEPFLANVKTQFGITDYKLVLDESTTTPDLIDQNIMYAKIMIKPARAIEYIAIDFVVTSTGASFDD